MLKEFRDNIKIANNNDSQYSADDNILWCNLNKELNIFLFAIG